MTAFTSTGNNLRKVFFKSALLLISALTTPLSLAHDVPPDVVLKTVTLEVIAIIRQDEEIEPGVPAKFATRIETSILPLFDFTQMTQIAMARNWRFATPEQQQALTAEFKTLLVRTYFTALSSYRDHAIEFKRLRAASGDDEVTVKSVIKQPGMAPLTIDYDMQKMAAGWKVYDIKIEGVSLITTYRETFAREIREGGVDGLIQSLSDKNRQRDTRLRSLQTQNFYGPVIFRSLLLGRR